jgi:hypothetical protein
MGMENFGGQKKDPEKVEGFDIKKLEEAGLTQPEQVVYLKYLENLKKYHKESPWGKIKDLMKPLPGGNYTKEEEELLLSAFDKIKKLEIKEIDLLNEQEEIILKTLTDPEEKRRMFEEAELTPEEQKALEKYLEYKKTFKPFSKRTAWERLKGAGDGIPNSTPEEDRLRVSAVKKLISIERGKKEYEI